MMQGNVSSVTPMSSKDYFTPNDEVMTTIVFPTIAFCVGLIVAMLVGINKCKQWELDKVGEMRRTRRVIERITNRLREKNFRTIQSMHKARRIRKAAHQAQVAAAKAKNEEESPPLYSSAKRGSITCGRSPPPTYEDALLDEYYNECKPIASRRQSGVSTKYQVLTTACNKAKAGSSSSSARRRASSSAAKASSTRSTSNGRRTSRPNGGAALLNNNTPHVV